MATKRVTKRLVAKVRLANESEVERVFHSLKDAKAWAEAQEPEAQLADHRWREETVWRARVTDPDGRRRERIFTQKNGGRTAAIDWEKKMGAAFEHGFDPDLGKRTLASWHLEWLKGRPAEASSASSKARDASIWKNHIGPAFGHRSLASIKRNDVKGFIVSLIDEKGLAPEMARRVVGFLGIMLDGALDEGLIRTNPARGQRIKAPVQIAERTRKRKSWEALSRAEVLTLAGAVPPRFRAVVLTGCLAGLRFEELTGLRWSNVVLESLDLAGPQIKIAEVRVEVGGRLYHQVPKTGPRNVWITPELVTELRAQRERFAPAPGDLVFSAERGGPLRRNNFAKRILGPTAERVIGKWVSPHDLRRSCGSMLIAAGVDPVTAASILGDRVETFLAHYAKLYEGGMREALEKFSDYLNRGGIGGDSGSDGGERGLKETG